jgi:hypothetical protein
VGKPAEDLFTAGPVVGEVDQFTKVYNRLLRPLGAADQLQAPPGLRRALAVIDRHVDDYIAKARLKPAA